jgi:Family of unknown function (DUF6510)
MYFDGNRAAGLLVQAFGRDVTDALGVCSICGHRHAMAEAHVYDRAPGTVMVCPVCSNVEMVIVEIRGEVRVTLRGFRTIVLA